MYWSEDSQYRRQWRARTEIIIAIAQLALASIVAALYFIAAKPNDAGVTQYYTAFALIAFPMICAGRLAYVRRRAPGFVYGWLSAFVDIAILTTIILQFSSQYGTWAATLKAPTFGFYFILITLHAMRLQPRLTAAAGFASAAGWSLAVYSAYHSGAPITHSYVDYVSNEKLLIGAEIEKIIGLLIFASLLSIISWRAGKLLRTADDAAKAKARFLATMSHEIRTPMNGFLGMVDVLGASELNAKQREYLQVMRYSGDALLSLINDVFNISKIEAGRIQLNRDAFDIRKLVEDATIANTPNAAAKGLELVVSTSPGAASGVIGDADRLRQVLNNLINNAIKFTEEGYVHVNLDLKRENDAVAIALAVKDTGVGVPQSDQSRIFDAFEQIDSSSTRSYDGAGLGLAISKQLVGAMGGTIRLNSEPGEGSSFTVQLTLEAAAAFNDDQHIAIDASRIKGRRALLVDDLDVSRNTLREMLSCWGVDHVSAASGEEALKIVDDDKERFDIILLDYQMPQMHGGEAAQRIRIRPAHQTTPILLLNSMEAFTSFEAHNDWSVNELLTKPVRAAALFELLARHASRDVSHRTQPAPVESRAQPQSAPRPAGIQAQKPRLLIAEDNDVNRIVLEHMLGGSSFDLVFALDGLEAVEKFREGGADIVLMDFSMPNMDGLAATRAIRRLEVETDCRGSRLPILGLTAHASSQDHDAGMRAGMDEILTKPVKQAPLIEALKRRLAPLACDVARRA